MIQFISFFICMTLAVSSYATNGICLITAHKSKCWNNFTVKINIVDTRKNNLLGIIIIDKNELTKQQKINCYSGQTLQYSATFRPIMWRDDADKIYYSKQYIQIPKGENWELTIDFPETFSALPDPINGGC